MSVTALVSCIAIFTALAKCVYAVEDGKLIDALAHGGKAADGWYKLLPNVWSDTPEKHAIKLINAVADDLTAYLETERVIDREALLTDLHQFGPIIIARNAPVLAEMIVKQGDGDWQKATILVLGNIPGSEKDGRVGEGLNAFRSSAHNMPHRAAFARVLDHLHCALLSPQDLQQAVNAAMQSDIQARLGKVQDTVDDNNAILKMLLAKSQVEEAQQEEIETLRKALSELQEAQETGDEAAEAALAEILESGDTEKAIAFYQKRMAERNFTIQEYKIANAADLRSIGALAFLHDTQTALEAYQKAVELDPDNADGWNQLGRIYIRLGCLEKAELSYRKMEVVGRTNNDFKQVANALGNRVSVYLTRGNLDEAETIIKLSLEVAKEWNLKEICANQFGNLGVVYDRRGEFVKAAKFYKNSFSINRKLGRKEGMANQYNNLGIVFLNCSKLPGTERFLQKSLKIYKKLERQEHVAAVYGNLGALHKKRNELDEAEVMFKKSMNINKNLGQKENLAKDYANLGGVYVSRRNQQKARKYWQKSLTLFTEIGDAPMIELVQGWLDGLLPV